MREPKKITELWAWVVTEADGGEGIAASSRILPGYLMPLVAADADRAWSLENEAQLVAAAGGLPLKLMRFTSWEVVKSIDPSEYLQAADG